MKPLRADKLFFYLAMSAAVASALGFGFTGKAKAPRPRVSQGPGATGSEFYPEAAVDFASNGVRWDPPRAQMRGDGWIYEVFTPPEIFYDELAREFTVTAWEEGVAKPPANPTGLELVDVQAEPCAIQLIAYGGSAQRWVGSFEKLGTGEVMLAASGDELPGTGFEVESLEMRPIGRPGPAEDFPSRREMEAMVIATETGERIPLTVGTRCDREEFLATLRATGGHAGEYGVRAGDEVTGLDARFELARVELNPPTVWLRRIGSIGRDTKEFVLRRKEDGQSKKTAAVMDESNDEN
ncbi:MAG: hypothetical protein JWM32_3247 [Verrucomicrobia bacterium]|nr:hypothetical protein [Verrucomicrobiota bacterium]